MRLRKKFIPDCIQKDSKEVFRRRIFDTPETEADKANAAGI